MALDPRVNWDKAQTGKASVVAAEGLKKLSTVAMGPGRIIGRQRVL